MPRFKIVLEYDGTRYSGWQLQKNARSVQGELLEVAKEVFKTEDLELYGAGRTDAGVHARGQVLHLDVPDRVSRLTPEQIVMRMNDLLPHDINLLSAEKAHPRFHARHDARNRVYTYTISKRRDAFGKKYVWWVRDKLDLAQMRRAAAMLTGFHDFSAFGDTELPGQSTTVSLTRAEVTEDANRIYIHLEASHFLWKMVRRIVGVLVEVGRGNLPPETVAQWLETPVREAAKYTAPPSGLTLDRVDY